MAEAIVSFAVERLGDLLISEAKSLHGVKKEIEEIQREMKRMQCFLEEADKKQIVDKRVQNWVSEMRELAFKTEDVIETFAYKRRKSGFKEKLGRLPRLHKIGKEINAIRDELSNLAAGLPTYGITKGLEEGETSNSMYQKYRRIFYPHNIEKDFVGMEKEIEQLISHLRKDDKGCDVVSICGMGGLGKTTVATQIYNHAQVKAHFEAFGWVCVTQQFNWKKVLSSILEQLLPAARKNEVSGMGDEVLVSELHKVQQEKNCLVIIDDIWTIDAWRELCSAFPIGVTKSSSKILLTTRNEKVAEIGSVYKLSGLTEEEGWQLLSMKAFPVTGDSPVKEMESIGRQMVERCRGLPLAVSTLGGMLRGKTLKQWETISRDISFYLDRGEGIGEYHTVTQVLGLSYDSLPPRLRQCFLCLANYEEDEEIEVEQLYLFWIAEGLVSVEDKAHGEMMLSVAELYLDELAQRSLVQVVPWEEEGLSWSRFRKCRVHDLIRELCLSKVKEEKVIKVIDSQLKTDHDLESTNTRIRRLCIRGYNYTDEPCVEPSVYRQAIPKIRSLLLFKDAEIFTFEKFELLRTLIVGKTSSIDGEHLTCIGKLNYLTYFSLYGLFVERTLLLPSGMGNLRNLKTLDLRVDGILRISIPNILWKFKQLKHLYLPKYYLEGPKEDQEKLKFDGMNELELIEGFDYSYCETHDLIGLSKIKVFEGTIAVDEENPMVNTIELIKSKELRYSRLTIKGGGAVSLVSLLETSFVDCLNIMTPISVLPNDYDHNHFSGRLINLSLQNCGIENFDPMIFVEKLPNLRHLLIGFKSYKGREMICSATGFPELQTLKFSQLLNLTSWRVDQGAMPNLSTLQIYECTKLEMLPDGLRFLTTLKHLKIITMPTAFSDRIKVIEGEEGPDFYKVRYVPFISVDDD